MVSQFLRSAVLKVLPKSTLGDKIYSFLCFLGCHKRLPNSSDDFIDTLYRTKVDGTLQSSLRCFISDKYYMKVFVDGVLGFGYTVPTLALLNCKEDIDKFVAEQECVVKPSHSSGFVKFCSVGDKLDDDNYHKWLYDNYYEYSREFNYKNLPGRLIVEPLLFDDKNIKDYKFFFLDGRFLFVQVDVDRSFNHTRSFYDRNFSFLGFSTKYPLSPVQCSPSNFDEMLEVAEKLAKHFCGLIRIDLYSNGTELKVGEITNCHGSGFEHIVPEGRKVLLSDYL
ncbi:ATP-grasp fold amidoligase family protein [Ferrimonas balearica]|uniref:ATP-grasp fold amidoligase family protein n=1 Tax=Ferrimonas balearica TaxID=44012 RepID=UPI001F1B1823|nr:ATP-grasp fold amidoligase family protein [Ferrimonas balearica]